MVHNEEQFKVETINPSLRILIEGKCELLAYGKVRLIIRYSLK
jgi:hypothetical protein